MGEVRKVTNLTWAELTLEIDLGQSMGVMRPKVATCAQANKTTLLRLIRNKLVHGQQHRFGKQFESQRKGPLSH